MENKKYTGYTDKYGNKIYESDYLFNYSGEEFYVTYNDGEHEKDYDTPGLICPDGDYAELDYNFAEQLSTDFNRIYNSHLFLFL